MTDLTLILGSVTFQGFEIPDRITGLGGAQMLVIHKLVGGARVIDAMGRDDAPIEWAGRFRGADAISRARAVDAMRIAGADVQLSFGEVLETVKIAHFTYEVERVYEVPYSICLEIISDLSTPAQQSSVDDMMRSDNASAQALGASIGDSPLSGLLAGLDTAISGVSSFATAAQSEIASVLAPIAAVQSRVTTLIASAETTLLGVATLGGIVPNNPASVLAANLAAQVGAMTQVANLYDLQNTMGRMGGNLGAVGAAGSLVTVAGGDLYTEAEKAYGDATAWPTIAKASGLTDPMLSGVQTLLVPPSGGATGGVLQP